MCEKGKCCQKPEQLKGRSEECSAEQIKQCHGDVKGHPCLRPTRTSPGEGENG